MATEQRTIRLHPAQQAFVRSEALFRCLVGGIGSRLWFRQRKPSDGLTGREAVEPPRLLRVRSEFLQRLGDEWSDGPDAA